MAEAGPQFLHVGAGAPEGASGRRIAYLADPGRPGKSPGVMWLSGLKSEMTSTKASVLAEWAAARGHACTRFDYSGHGQSPGRFEDGTIGAWLEEALAIFRQVTRGDQILVGSSMGGYIALLVLRALMREAPAEAARVKALLLIAPAWDMTERLMWRKMSAKTQAKIEREGVYYAPSLYGDPYPLTRLLIEEGRSHLLGNGTINLDLPVRILQGMCDPDVPWGHALDLVDLLCCDDVEITLIKDGDHRQSREQDLRRLEATVAALVERASTAT